MINIVGKLSCKLGFHDLSQIGPCKPIKAKDKPFQSPEILGVFALAKCKRPDCQQEHFKKCIGTFEWKDGQEYTFEGYIECRNSWTYWVAR